MKLSAVLSTVCKGKFDLLTVRGRVRDAPGSAWQIGVSSKRAADSCTIYATPSSDAHRASLCMHVGESHMLL